MDFKVAIVLTVGAVIIVYMVAPNKVTAKYKDFEFTAER